MYNLNVKKLCDHIAYSHGIVQPAMHRRSCPLSLVALSEEALTPLVLGETPVAEWMSNKSRWTLKTHLGRIRHLVETGGWDPIKVNLSGNTGMLCIVDGQHRLIAAKCSKHLIIPALYIGRTDIPFAYELLTALQ